MQLEVEFRQVLPHTCLHRPRENAIANPGRSERASALTVSPQTSFTARTSNILESAGKYQPSAPIGKIEEPAARLESRDPAHFRDRETGLRAELAHLGHVENSHAVSEAVLGISARAREIARRRRRARDSRDCSGWASPEATIPPGRKTRAASAKKKRVSKRCSSTSPAWTTSKASLSNGSPASTSAIFTGTPRLRPVSAALGLASTATTSLPWRMISLRELAAQAAHVDHLLIAADAREHELLARGNAQEIAFEREMIVLLDVFLHPHLRSPSSREPRAPRRSGLRRKHRRRSSHNGPRRFSPRAPFPRQSCA